MARLAAKSQGVFEVAGCLVYVAHGLRQETEKPVSGCYGYRQEGAPMIFYCGVLLPGGFDITKLYCQKCQTNSSVQGDKGSNRRP